MAARLLQSVMKRICLCAASLSSQDWSKHDERLLQAVENNDSEKVGSLLTKRSLFAAKQDSDGRSAYHLAAMKGYVDCLEVILSHGVDVSAMDSSGMNALHLAARYGHHQCVKRLLQERCPVNTMDSYGRTALHYAAASGSLCCVQTICDFKGSLNVYDEDGCSPLILAAQMSNHEICRWLIVRGADVNTRDKQGRTALMLACENDSVETVEVLVRSRANVGLVDALGHDAVHYSMVTGNTEILHLLHMGPHRRYWSKTELELAGKQQQMMAKEKSLTPRKRRAPPPPSSLSTQSPSQSSEILSTSESTSPSYSSTETLTPKEDQKLSNEIFLLQQERDHLLHTISNLEQLVDKCQREKVLMAKDGAVKKLERQIQDLLTKLTEKEQENHEVVKEIELLRDRVASYEDKQHGLNDGEVLDEEEVLFDFPGTENLILKKSLPHPREELVGSLQNHVDSLIEENKELQCRLQEMECLQKESDKEDISGGEDFIPILLYDSLRAEFEKLKEECELLRDQATVHEEGMSSETLVPLETYEQLKASHEQEVLKLQEALNELKAKMDLEVEGCIQPHLESELASVEKNTEQDIQDMTEKLNEVQERYETAMKEVERLKEQIHLGILSMEDREISPGLDGSKATYEHETESVEMKLLETREAEELKENWLKELEEQVKEMEEKLTHSISLETFEELRTSLNISLEEISKENALLMEKYTEAQDELKQLRAANEAEESHLGSCEEGTKVSPEFTATADELKEKLEKLTKSYSELEERFRVLQEEHETKEKELGSLQEELTAMHVPKHKHEEVKQKLSKSLSDANEQLLEIKGKHNTIRQEVTRLQSEVEEQRVHFMPRDEHLKMKEAFEAMKGTVSHLENQLASKQKEYSQLQRQVETTREQTTLKDEQESTVTSLKAEVNSLTIKLNDLTKKHERTCTEVFQVQREALFMKSQKHSAEDELAATQKQLQDLKADSKKITELHKHIEDSAELVKEKDKKITELSKEVFRLKEALNSLSERSNAAAQRVQPAPYKTQPNLEYLESQIKALQHQLKEAENHHKAILSIYRTHLLYAIQGRMDEDVQQVLLQILKLHKRQEKVI
ncbi:ankyrin repeat domain-containing protein 24 isoform X1 [Callorhinchus milii]|uniref:ankyrin repeat domain-containing protein 24 isoform X1 n=1 Tax=Callorhinchus milii TaxID=7868 RepID=UPI001C3FB239|nr:ankyrin repeat domain-containing protein 24 isoform X1 [Callorhinchus milii]